MPSKIERARALFQNTKNLKKMEYNPDHLVQTEIDAYLSSVFPDEGVCKWVQNEFAKMNRPLNPGNNKIYIWYGAGATGKSCLTRLLEGAYGSKFISADASILETKYPEKAVRSLENHNVFMCETENNQIRLKNLEYLLFYAPNICIGDIHIICNTLPTLIVGEESYNIPDRMRQLQDYMRVIPFNVKFTETPEYKAGINPVKESWFAHFMQRMLAMYEASLTSEEVIQTPEAIVAATSQLFADHVNN